MNRRPLFFLVLVTLWWLPLLLLSIAVCYEALKITGKATEYVARGKIIVTPPTRSPSLTSVDAKEVMDGTLTTQTEILESNELRRRALERVRGLHSELKESDVEIRVNRSPGSFILKVSVVGSEQKYTRVYLDALLDEYMAFREGIKAKGGNDSVSASVMERPSVAVPDEPELTRPLVTAAVIGGGGGLTVCLLVATFIALLFGKEKPVLA